MYYTTAIFNEKKGRKLEYSFKVNIQYGELEVIYDNFLGGYTTKGMKLNRKQCTYLKQLLKIENFEHMRKSLEDDTLFVCMFSISSWELQLISNDGYPMLEVSSEEYMRSSKYIDDLTTYIANIAIEPEVIKRMSCI